MNKYELALVVNAKLEEEERAAVVEKAKGYVTRYGGTVGEVEEWGKKRLAYEIQHMREAYYYFIQFEADATAPAEIESHMRIMDNVLRYLVIHWLLTADSAETAIPQPQTLSDALLSAARQNLQRNTCVRERRSPSPAAFRPEATPTVKARRSTRQT